MTTLSDRYGPDAQLPCRCGAWYGPTDASHKAHRAVFGHWPVSPRATAPASGGDSGERTDPDQGAGDGA